VGHLIFPIIILIIAIVRAASRAGQSTGGPPPRRAPGPTPRQTESEEERQRRFFEAVGLPPGGQLPPTVNPRTTSNLPPLQPVSPPLGGPIPSPGRLRRISTGYPHQAGPLGSPASARRVAAPMPPPASVPAPAPQPQVAPVMVPVQTAAVIAAATAAAPSAPATAVRQFATVSVPSVAPGMAAQASSSTAGLLARLRDPDSMRQAIMLREILGPPKALQTSMVGGEGALWIGA
jgi:hypothetical protein